MATVTPRKVGGRGGATVRNGALRCAALAALGMGRSVGNRLYEAGTPGGGWGEIARPNSPISPEINSHPAPKVSAPQTQKFFNSLLPVTPTRSDPDAPLVLHQAHGRRVYTFPPLVVFAQ